jgi:hypothetical protein
MREIEYGEAKMLAADCEFIKAGAPQRELNHAILAFRGVSNPTCRHCKRRQVRAICF